MNDSSNLPVSIIPREIVKIMGNLVKKKQSRSHEFFYLTTDFFSGKFTQEETLRTNVANVFVLSSLEQCDHMDHESTPPTKPTMGADGRVNTATADFRSFFNFFFIFDDS